MLKRIGLFLLMNLAIMLLFSVVVSVLGMFGIELTSNGNIGQLAIYALVWGFIASFFSLFLSKWMAKRAYKISLLDDKHSLYQLTEKIAKNAGMKTPEVGIYQSSDINAFATGWSKNNALMAVSSEMLKTFSTEELEGVIGHELAHIKNGDMVTMALLQGVINAFVIVAAKLASEFVKDKLGDSIGVILYNVIYIAFQLVFGFLAMPVLMAFSRHREYKADSGSALMVGKQKMIAALEKIKKSTEIQESNKEFVAFGIQGKRSGFLKLLSSHPDLDDRINKLRNTNGIF